MGIVNIAGLDGSLRNFGIALMTLNTETLELGVKDLMICKTDKSKSKQVRTSSDNHDRAQTIARFCEQHLKQSVVSFAEIPSGGQSYHAVLGFGIVIGIYASLARPPLEVSPSETKMATVGSKTASKQEMIEWGFNAYPNAPWLLRKSKGVMVPTLDNEHLADAVAVAHAGIRTPAFLQVLSILRAQAA